MVQTCTYLSFPHETDAKLCPWLKHGATENQDDIYTFSEIALKPAQRTQSNVRGIWFPLYDKRNLSFVLSFNELDL